ncbi:hypothetical protein Bca101_021500 [Brassica carinata]
MRFQKNEIEMGNGAGIHGPLRRRSRRNLEMAMPLGMATYLMRMVWFSLSGWVFTCLSIADEIAGSLRNGDIGPFHVG